MPELALVKIVNWPVEGAGHVRVVGDHAVPDSLSRQTCGLGTAKDAKNIVLRAGEPRRFQEMFRFLAEGVSGLQERYEDAVLQRDGRARGLGAQGHVVSIVVITMIVKRDSVALASRRLRVSAPAEAEFRSRSSRVFA